LQLAVAKGLPKILFSDRDNFEFLLFFLFLLCLDLLLLADASIGIGHLHVELSSAGEDGLAGLEGDGVGNLGGVGAVIGEEELNVSNILNGEGVELVGALVLGGLVRAIANLDHGALTVPAAADAGVNTLGLPPSGLLNPNKMRKYTREGKKEKNAKQFVRGRGEILLETS